MASIPTTLSGLLISVLPERAYDFTDKETDRQVKGTTRDAYIAVSATEPPVKLRFPDESVSIYRELQKAGQWAGVEVSGTVEGPRNDQYVKVSGLRSVEPAAA